MVSGNLVGVIQCAVYTVLTLLLLEYGLGEVFTLWGEKQHVLTLLLLEYGLGAGHFFYFS